MTKDWIHKNIIEPNFFVERTTFFNYLSTNADKELKQKTGIDYAEYRKNQIRKNQPINYMRLMEETKQGSLFDIDLVRKIKNKEESK